MRWKISPWKINPWKPNRGGHHDPRQIDLIAALALVIAAAAACIFLSDGHQPPSKAAFIVPSQSVRW